MPVCIAAVHRSSLLIAIRQGSRARLSSPLSLRHNHVLWALVLSPPPELNAASFTSASILENHVNGSTGYREAAADAENRGTSRSSKEAPTSRAFGARPVREAELMLTPKRFKAFNGNLNRFFVRTYAHILTHPQSNRAMARLERGLSNLQSGRLNSSMSRIASLSVDAQTLFIFKHAFVR